MNDIQPDEDYLKAFREAIAVTIAFSRRGVINHGARISMWLTNRTKKNFLVEDYSFTDLFKPERFLVRDEEDIVVPCIRSQKLWETDSPRRSFDAIPGTCWSFKNAFACVALSDCIRIGLRLSIRQGDYYPVCNEYPIQPGKRYSLTYQFLSAESNTLDLEPLMRDTHSVPSWRLKPNNYKSPRKDTNL